MESPQQKIAFLITKSNFGGAQKYVYELAVEAKRRGFAVMVACGGTGEARAATGDLVTNLQQANIATHTITNFMRSFSVLRDLRATREVWRWIRFEKPDTLHVTSSKAGGIGAFAGRLAGIPNIIFTAHGLPTEESWRSGLERRLIWLGTWITILLTHKTIMISTQSFKTARRMPFCKHKVILIRNGVGKIEFMDRAAARAKLAPHFPPDTLWIGGIGELHPNKNWQQLLEALSALPDNVRTVIIGEGETRPELETYITTNKLADRVQLAGYQIGAPLLHAFDIFVLPSKKEGLPYVLLEAGLATLPVVASNIPGNRDIITHQETGLLFSDSTELTEQLTTLLQNQTLRHQYGTTLQEHVTETFSREQMFRETFALYTTSTSTSRN